MPFSRPTMITFVVLLAAVNQRGLPQSVPADVVGNQVSVTLKGINSFDASRGIYTYSYTVLNAANSTEDMRYFALRLGGVVMPDVLSSTAPAGWTFYMLDGRPIISWGANSTSRIKPGQQLVGFSFQSHAPPGNVTYYAQGYVKGPLAAPGDLDDEHAVLIPDFTEIGVNGTTTGPISSASSGPPSVRGFVVVLAPITGTINVAPVEVDLKFALDGESVDRTTFHAQLNGLDVTNSFFAGTAGAGLQATFNLGTSPLQSGGNDLIASVSGTDPQNGGSTTGISRVLFTVAKTIPGDVNGDGVVDCSDIAVVKAVFGMKTGQQSFDIRADVNSDGIVDIRDLSFVSQHLAARTKCQ